MEIHVIALKTSIKSQYDSVALDVVGKCCDTNVSSLEEAK